VSLPRLRTPQDDGQVLVYPPPESLGRLFDRNRARLATRKTIFGRQLSDFRRQAIIEAISAAHAYFAEAGEPAPEFTSPSLLLAGHQPDLFHPGVWLKNFAIQSIGREHGAGSLNLVVDNDTVKHTSIAVPAFANDPQKVHRVLVPYDAFASAIPFEERTIREPIQFADFPRTVERLTRDWSVPPIITQFWDDVLRRQAGTPLVGEMFAAARRSLERRWGCHNLEVPLSRLCRTASFAEFAVGLLKALPDFHNAYNAAVRGYRKRNGIRNAQHPVPDLAHDGDWLESPFWAWRAGIGRRERLFVRVINGRLHLRAGQQPWPDLPLATDAAAWLRLEPEGFKIRTRALTTTLFARLLLADAFVHGIGGGKYDELTDELITTEFGMEPPGFLVVTGTLRLPLPRFNSSEYELHAAERAIRDLDWNPQRHLNGGWRDKHAALLKEPAESRRQRRSRGEALKNLNAEMRPLVANQRRQVEELTQRLSLEVHANAILGQRDYAFVLYPEEKLRRFLTQSLHGAIG
jgi:hypothetical protein